MSEDKKTYTIDKFISGPANENAPPPKFRVTATYAPDIVSKRFKLALVRLPTLELYGGCVQSLIEALQQFPQEVTVTEGEKK